MSSTAANLAPRSHSTSSNPRAPSPTASPSFKSSAAAGFPATPTFRPPAFKPTLIAATRFSPSSTARSLNLPCLKSYPTYTAPSASFATMPPAGPSIPLTSASPAPAPAAIFLSRSARKAAPAPPMPKTPSTAPAAPSKPSPAFIHPPIFSTTAARAKSPSAVAS